MNGKPTPLPWDCDEIATPFYNDAEGNSRGGEGTGFYEVFGHGPFCEEECEVEGDAIVVVERTSKEDAKLIVRAVNNHDALVEALQAVLKWVPDGKGYLAVCGKCGTCGKSTPNPSHTLCADCARKMAENALAKAAE